MRLPCQSSWWYLDTLNIGTSGSIATAAALPRRPKFVQIYVAHDLKLMAGNAGIDFLYPGDENQLFPMPKKNMARFANNDCCWHILLTTINPQEMSCWNQLRGPVSHKFSSWIAVNFATAATNSLAAETDITSYRVHERPRWIWNKRIHRMQKNSTNIEIYEKPIRAVSWWASIITSHNNNGFPASASLCVFS